MKTHRSLPARLHGGTVSPGFALIATLMLMLLLVLLAIGMLSLSSVSLRGASVSSAQEEARANARMALMLAVAELQKNSGLDTRITAPANIIAADAPPLTGVWKSWEGTNHDSTGRPIKPDYEVKTTAESAKTASNNNGRFLTWLVSGAVAGENIDTPSELLWTNVPSNAEPPTDHIPLLHEGALGEDKPGQVHVKPKLVENGAMAWWVSPENQKARLQHPHEPRSQDSSGWSDLAKSHAAPDLKPFGLDTLLDDPEDYVPDTDDPKASGKAITLATSEFLVSQNTLAPQHSFHNLSTSSIGLLTNSATGGWRKDLSILSEKWINAGNNLAATKLPLFRIAPSANATFPKATTEVTRPTVANPTETQSIFYPWSAYGVTGVYHTNPSSTHYAEHNGAAATWHSLVDFATSYRNVAFDAATGIGSVPLSWARTHKDTDWGPNSGNYTKSDLFNYLHKTQNGPILARIQWIFKIRARRKNYDPNTAQYNQFDVDLLVSPVYTLWNPYNVSVTINDHIAVAMNKTFPMAIGLGKAGAPLSFRRYINGSKYWTYRQGDYDSTLEGNYTQHWEQTNGQAARFPREFSLLPGQVKVFSLEGDAFAGQSGIIGDLKSGYDGTINTGYLTAGGNPKRSNPILPNYTASDKVEIDMKFDNITQLGPQPNQKGPGIMLTLSRAHPPGGSQYLGDNYIRYSMLTSKEFSTKYWQRPERFPSPSMGSIVVEPSDNSGAYNSFNSGNNRPWTPVFSVVFGPRITIGAGAGNAEDRPTKGFLVNNPFITSALTTSDLQWTNHPVNIPFDFTIHAHQDGNSPTLPDDSAEDGFIATGFQEADGLSRLIMTELPLRPMASLVELQHWNLQGNKPVPPFQYYIIGNSDASPLIDKDSILPRTPLVNDISKNLQHDDSYCANHLLFDDWFFSSIAPTPEGFGSTNLKPMETVYQEYLTGKGALTNRAYRPILADKDMAPGNATLRVGEIIGSSDGWLKVASRFEVDGMFNINSTSISAWRAILGHARNQKIAYHGATGVGLDQSLHDHPVSRHAVAADAKASDAMGFGAKFTSGSQYGGFRTLSGTQLDDLAREIVNQVQRRGPFLSLSEFINRRLDEDEDVALAGAVQTALQSLQDDPNSPLKDAGLSSPTMSPSDPKIVDAEYAFEGAAVGRNVFGFPGWIRQADVLRPIAPILSARDDTFTIRAYGDSRDSTGSVRARAWCEATVRRSREFLDPRDAPDMINSPSNSDPSKPNPNVLFGRRYEVVAFRFLSQDEV